jgi:hypothetical protein
VIEIRHYVSRAGKDVFDDWLSELADARARAKIATRINRLAAGDITRLQTTADKVCASCESIGGQATGSIMRWWGKCAYYFSAATTKENSRLILPGRSNTSAIIKKGAKPYET